MPDQRVWRCPGIVGEIAWMRLGANDVSGWRLHIDPRGEEIPLGCFLGEKSGELCASDVSARLFCKIPLNANKPVVVDDVALGLKWIEQLQPVGGRFDERHAMPGLARRAI